MKSVLIIFLTLAASCNRGLEPIEDRSNYINGVLIITGGVIPDSATAVRIGAFKKESLDSLQEFISEIINQDAYLSDTLNISSNRDTLEFSIKVTESDITLNYIVASMEINGLISNQRLIGVYGGAEEQKSLTLTEQETRSIDIFVDFNNLPPQPF